MKAINRISANIFIIFNCFIFWLVTCPSVWGQADQKKILTPDYYHLWNLLIPEKISCSGNWVSYSLNYENPKKK